MGVPPNSTQESTIVTVYSKPSCVQCNATYRDLDRHKIEYEVKDLTQEPEMLELFKSENLMQAPVVVTPEDRWSGFRPDKIGALASGRMEAAATAA